MLVYLELWTWGGRLPVTGTDWLRITNMTRPAWRSVEKEVLQAFEHQDGFIVAPDLVEQTAKITEQSTHRRRAGTESGRARAAQGRGFNGAG